MSTPALRVLEGAQAAGGWQELWARDEWRERELPHGDLTILNDREVVIRFGGLLQPWLKEAAKRWARMRLLSGSSPSTMAIYVREVRAFSRWLVDAAPEVIAPGLISRQVLEDYMLWVSTQPLSAATRHRRLTALRTFMDDQCTDGLAGLPRGAIIRSGEMPRVDFRPPKGLDKQLFDQLVDPENLKRLRCEQHRTAIVVLAYTGMRVSSLVLLRRDALEFGSDGHPYLRFQNVKLRREAMIPIASQLVEQLARQEQYLLETHPGGTSWLLASHPPRGSRGHGRGGAFHLATETVRDILHDYVRKAEIRDRDGNLATWIHPHLFRHHLGTSMVNKGVPLPVIQQVFDHASIVMTSRYAQLNDDTIRLEVMGWHERVNIRGERIALPIDGLLGEAAWMKERIARARQALPNGYCGLPLVQTCPHPNACLSCDNFLTDNSFRPVHEQQLEHTRTLRDQASQNGSLRLVEVLERDEQSLTKILTGLNAIDADQHEQDPGPPLGLVGLAAARQRDPGLSR